MPVESEAQKIISTKHDDNLVPQIRAAFTLVDE